MDIGGLVTLQESQVMFAFSGPGILGIGFVIAILLIVIGFRERTEYHRRVRFLRTGGILFGVMIIITGTTLYGYLATTIMTPMTFQDVLILSGISSFGGLIIGISIYYPVS